RQSEGAVGRMEDTMWLIAITFLTIGYGDITPKTSCGKTVCLLTGVMGVSCTAMLVAVVAKNLSLNKAEKHVHQFMMDIKHTKKIRTAAANVLRECWLLHRSCRDRRDSRENRRNQRRLLEAIRVFRKARLKQRKLRDHANEMVDLSKLQVMMCDFNGNWSSSYKELERRIGSMEQKMDELSRAFQETSQLISRAVQHRARDNDVL
ncbi:KCNN4 protein, partial [Polyodon spathula]|nr:KCNN4 protein [Polyodon spathula]